MKVQIYTDLHCSYTSSILPLYSGESSKFTTRLEMIVNTGRWLSDLAKKENVDLIINGGDTFDSIIVKAEELVAISEFFKCFEEVSCDHYVLVGNHEKVNENFNGSEIFSGFKSVHVVDKPKKITDEISLLPYMQEDLITHDLLKTIRGKLLVSHIDIQGSCLRDSYILDSGVNPEMLAEYFEFVANGHLHTAEKLKTTQNEVWNIGGVSSISFVDNQEYIPSCVIFDTETKTFKRYENPYSILFRKISIDTVKDLLLELKKLPENPVVLSIKFSNYEQKVDLQNILDKNSKVLNYKLVNTVVDPGTESLDLVDVTSLDVKSKFEEFLDTTELRYEKQDYLNLLKAVN